MSNLEYRANFITWALVDIGWTIMDLIFFSALVSQIKTVGTWSLGEMLILLGISRVMVVPIWAWMYQSFSQITNLVTKGDLDFILVKPADSQFLVSIRYFAFSIIPSLVGGLILIYAGFKVLGHYPTIGQVFVTLTLLLTTTILAYGLYFSSVAITLYVGRLNNIHHIFTQLYDNAKYPVEIYPSLLRNIFVTAVPLGLMLLVPAGYLISRLTLTSLIEFLITTVIYFFIARFIWTKGLRRYSSASS